MPIFLKVNCVEGFSLWLNFDKVVSLDRQGDFTQVGLAHEEAYYKVLETPEQLVTMLRREIREMRGCGR